MHAVTHEIRRISQRVAPMAKSTCTMGQTEIIHCNQY